MPVPLFAFSMLLATPIAALAAGANRSRSIIDAMASKTIWLGGLCCAASFVAALYAMRSSGVAWVLTLRNSSIGFAQLLGWLLLRERPSRRGIAGVALVLAGAFAVGIR